jgi:hypothetical protein
MISMILQLMLHHHFQMMMISHQEQALLIMDWGVVESLDFIGFLISTETRNLYSVILNRTHTVLALTHSF